MKTTDLDPAGQVAAWNTLYPVGTLVTFWKNGTPGGTGVTLAPAALATGTGRAVVTVSGMPYPVPVTGLQALRTTAEPCAVCDHPKATHSVRYVAHHGHHEWTDPLAREVAYVAEPATNTKTKETQ